MRGGCLRRIDPSITAAATCPAVAPLLYVLAVGESNYQKSELKLGFPAKDAKDFAAAMAKQKGGLYRDVKVKVLADASKEDIEDGLDWLQHQVTSRDVGMLFSLATASMTPPVCTISCRRTPTWTV
jgi:hypothetical protein